MRISDWSSDVCSSDLLFPPQRDKCPCAFLASIHQPGVGQYLQMPRHARLALAQNLRKLAHRQLHGTKQRHDPEPRRVRQRGEDVDDDRHAVSTHKEVFISMQGRSEERSVGKECVSTCKYR